MTRKARVWTGVTLLMILAFNYLMIGYPLAKKAISINKRANKILMVKTSDDEFVIDILRKERRSIESKMFVLNCVSASLLIVIASWTLFGLILHRKK